MDEKLEKALECCSRVDCCACPLLMDVNCMSNLYAEVKRYINELEERISIMQESMDALEKRNEPQPPNYGVICEAHHAHTGYKCPNCGNEIKYLQNYCSYCGQEVRWSE